MKIPKSIITLLFLSFFVQADTIQSPFNGLILTSGEVENEYSFIITGHLYGKPSKAPTTSAATFLESIDMINNLDIDFTVFLGDCYYEPESLQINNFIKTTSKIESPVFNAIGNHEGDDWQLYADYFGKTYFNFNYGSSVFVFIDLEMTNEKYIGEQYDFISEVTNKILNDSSIKNVFICTHKLIWLYHLKTLKENLEEIMWPQTYYTKIDYDQHLRPMLDKLSENKKVYWLSGDWYLPLFYHKDTATGVTYIATGLDDNEKDAIIKINVDANSVVSFQTLSLTGKKLSSLESYDINYYIDEVKRLTSMSVKANDFINSGLKMIHENNILSLIIFLLLGFTVIKLKNR